MLFDAIKKVTLHSANSNSSKTAQVKITTSSKFILTKASMKIQAEEILDQYMQKLDKKITNIEIISQTNHTELKAAQNDIEQIEIILKEPNGAFPIELCQDDVIFFNKMINRRDFAKNRRIRLTEETQDSDRKFTEFFSKEIIDDSFQTLEERRYTDRPHYYNASKNTFISYPKKMQSSRSGSSSKIRANSTYKKKYDWRSLSRSPEIETPHYYTKSVIFL